MDTFNHETGDLLLVELGCFLQENIKKSDISCHFGRDEFVLVLPELKRVVYFQN